MKERTQSIRNDSTSRETGYTGYLDTEGFTLLTATNSASERIGRFATREALSELGGITEIFFDSAEISRATGSVADFLLDFPAGDVTLEATKPGGEIGSITADFTHTIPAGPALVAPADGATIAVGDVAFDWDEVTTDIDGNPVQLIAYKLVVTNLDFDQGDAGRTRDLVAYVPANVTSVEIPGAFFEAARNYEWQVYAVETSGNETSSSRVFATTNAGTPVANTSFVEQATLFIEHNATDEDTGFQFFCTTKGYVSLELSGPNGQLIDFTAENALADAGIAFTSFETVEPENRRVPINETLAKVPEGLYTFTFTGTTGVEHTATKVFDHAIPNGPELLSPKADAELDLGDIAFSWNPVTTDLDGNPVAIVSYQLLVLNDDAKPENLTGEYGLDIILPASVTTFTVPRELLIAGEYEWEVLAIADSGNQTLSSRELELR